MQTHSPIRRIILGLALAAVFVHAVGGCCCHHAHAAEVLSTSSEHGGNDHDVAEAVCQEHGEDGSDPADHRHGNPCTEATCSFIVLKSADTFVPPLVSSPVSAVLHDSATAPPSRILDRVFCLRQASWGSPLRLHLLNQIFLL